MRRSAPAQAVLPHADAMLAVGCRFTEVMTDWRRMPVPSRLVQIDLDPEQIGMNHPVAVGIVADADGRLPRAARRPCRHREPRGSGWGTLWDEARAAPAPEARMADRDPPRSVLPDDVPVFTDACEMGYRMQADWPSHGPRRFFYPSNYITLGWAFPAAVGAAVALGDRPVVSVSGDGGFVMTAQELATAARYQPPGDRDRPQRLDLRRDQEHPGPRPRGPLPRHRPEQPRLPPARRRLRRPRHARRATPRSSRAAVREALDRDGPSLIEVPDRWRFMRDLANPVRSPAPSSPTV